MASQQWMLGVIKLIFAGAGIVAVVYFVLVPLWRMLRAKPDLERLIPDFTLPDEEQEGELQIPVGQQKPDRTELLNMARSDPRRTAMILSRWIRERK